MKRVIFHPEASEEFFAAVEYHLAISAELGDRFHSEIQRLVEDISRDPLRFFQFHPTASTCAVSGISIFCGLLE